MDLLSQQSSPFTHSHLKAIAGPMGYKDPTAAKQRIEDIVACLHAASRSYATSFLTALAAALDQGWEPIATFKQAMYDETPCTSTSDRSPSTSGKTAKYYPG
eukprot:15475138-Alexandrium_andersonii.AAC.1